MYSIPSLKLRVKTACFKLRTTICIAFSCLIFVIINPSSFNNVLDTFALIRTTKNSYLQTMQQKHQAFSHFQLQQCLFM